MYLNQYNKDLNYVFYFLIFLLFIAIYFIKLPQIHFELVDLGVIKRIAKKLIPKIKKAETERMAKKKEEK